MQFLPPFSIPVFDTVPDPVFTIMPIPVFIPFLPPVLVLAQISAPNAADSSPTPDLRAMCAVRQGPSPKIRILTTLRISSVPHHFGHAAPTVFPFTAHSSPFGACVHPCSSSSRMSLRSLLLQRVSASSHCIKNYILSMRQRDTEVLSRQTFYSAVVTA